MGRLDVCAVIHPLVWLNLFLIAAATSGATPQVTPEETFANIERVFTQAKSIRARIKVPIGLKEFELNILLKSGNKVLFEEVIPTPAGPLTPEKKLAFEMFKPVDGGPIKGVTISNGKTMKTWLGGHELGGETTALADYGKLVTFALARGDIAWAPSAYIGRTAWPELDFEKTLAVSGLSVGPDEKGAKTLSYRLRRLRYPQDAVPESYFNVRVFYEPKTYRPLKRIYTQDGQEGSTTESFEELTVDEDIPDERFSIPEKGLPAPRPQEEYVLSALRSIRDAEEDFRDNDRDNNKVKDYWVGDVSGLYRLLLEGQEIREIPVELAFADSAPLDSSDLSPLKGKPVASHGYHFIAIKSFEKEGKAQAYDSGSHRNAMFYGILAFPAEYPRTGRVTYIMNETGSLFKKDTGGKPIETYPENPEQQGWERVR